MKTLLKLSFLVIFIGYGKTHVLPVGKCKFTDGVCMKEAFQKAVPIFTEGIPELGIDVMDPLELDNIAFDLSGLQFTLTNGTLRGLKGTVMDKVKWDLSKKRLETYYHLNGLVKGHYTAGGRLLILPVNGEGQFKLKLKNLAIKMGIDYDIVKEEDGKEYVKPKKYSFDHDVKDNAHFNMSNLFNGNKDLSDTLHTFLNQNWKQVTMEFGEPMIEGAAKNIYKNIVQFFSTQPIQDIFEL